MEKLLWDMKVKIMWINSAGQRKLWFTKEMLAPRCSGALLKMFYQIGNDGVIDDYMDGEEESSVWRTQTFTKVLERFLTNPLFPKLLTHYCGWKKMLSRIKNLLRSQLAI